MISLSPTHVTVIMGRPREFEMEQVLDAALEAFWAGGYHATSLTDLENATGLKRGSLYKAFPDKKAIFLAAVERYRQYGRGITAKIRAKGDTPRQALANFFTAIASQSCGPDGRKGCFFVNTIAETSNRDPEIAAEVKTASQDFERGLATIIQEGQDSGDIPSRRPASTLAKHLFYQIAAIKIAGENNEDSGFIDQLAHNALAVLDAV